MLAQAGYETRSAKDGLLGVAAAFFYLPDLIVCDTRSPKLDGFGVLLELRANPITVDIPFIFVTETAAKDDFRRGMASEADDYITRPFTHLELLPAIKTGLQKKTARKQNRGREVEALQEALARDHEQLALKGKFTAMFSHDFRNPITGILSSNTLLTDYSDRMDEARRLVHHHRITALARQLTQMLDDLLLAMQMDSGNLPFNPTAVSVEKLVQEFVEEFQAIYGETYTVIFESRFPNIVSADTHLLRPIAANLISNAIKYSSPGSNVHVTLEGSAEQFVLTVQDQGRGIPEADQAKLFSAFQRGSNVGEVGGTGLGLAIVKRAVDLHGGSIHFESQIDVGTRMHVTIPVFRTNELRSAQGEEALPDSRRGTLKLPRD